MTTNTTNDAPAVSVVVPVYNSEPYLERCLDTLVSQTLDSLEILVVNDGSPDDSQTIIDRYAAAYPERIRPLIKPNGGLSDARNFGVQHAKGRYIGFIDSDDYVETTMFSDLFEAIRRTDSQIAIGQFIHYGLNGKVTTQGHMPYPPGTVFSGTEFLKHNHVMVVWNKLYEASLPRRFPFPITWFEDVAWTPVVMTHAERVCYVDRPCYHYIRREGSIASSHEDPRTLQGITALQYALDHCESTKRDHVAYMAVNRLLFESRVRRCYADRYLRTISELKSLLENNDLFKNDITLFSRARRYLSDEMAFIPKRFYYTVLDDRDLSHTEQSCLQSWRADLAYGDGKIVCLNKDVLLSPRFTEIQRLCPPDTSLSHLEQYLRLHHVLEFGGIALATNVKANSFIAPHLSNSAIFAFADGNVLQSSLFGAVAGHAVIESIRRRFLELLQQDDRPDDLLAVAITSVLTGQYNLALDGTTQLLADGVRVFNPGIFSARYSSYNVTEIIPTQPRYSPQGKPEVRLYETQYVENLLNYRQSDRQKAASLKRSLAKERAKTRALKKRARARIAYQLPRSLDKSATVKKALTLGSRLKQLSKIRARMRTDEHFNRRTQYARFLEKYEVSHNLVLLESFYGRGMLSSPLALFRAWSRRSDFEKYRFAWVLDKLENHTDMIQSVTATTPNVFFVERGSLDYFRVLATAGLLINDVTFFFDFIKRPEQLYVNTWHSITVKTLGYDLPNRPLDQKNVIRNLLSTDILLAPNDFMRDKVFLGAHRMHDIFPGTIVRDGHPRNDLTLNTPYDHVAHLLSQTGIAFDPNKKTLIYAPTWRGTDVHNPTDNVQEYGDVLHALQQAGTLERYNVLLRLHQASHDLVRGTPFERYAIPPTIDANELLSAVDVLITDYSSIAFDYLCTGRPVLFYMPDLSTYEESRGIYFSPEELPGPCFYDLSSLSEAVSKLDAIRSDCAEKYDCVRTWACPNDDGRVSERILENIIQVKASRNKPAGTLTSKPRFLLFAGSLRKPGLLDWLNATLSNLNLCDSDVTLLVTDYGHKDVNRTVRELLSRGVRVVGRSLHTVFTERERYELSILESRLRVLNSSRVLQRAFQREWRRCLGDARFDVIINLDDTSRFFVSLLAHGNSTLKLIRSSDSRAVHDGYDNTFVTNAELRTILSGCGVIPDTSSSSASDVADEPSVSQYPDNEMRKASDVS